MTTANGTCASDPAFTTSRSWDPPGSALDFWEGALGMPFLFDQPNLGKPDENHLYLDPGGGRQLTVFTK